MTIPYRNYFPVHDPHLDGQNWTILKQVVSISTWGIVFGMPPQWFICLNIRFYKVRCQVLTGSNVNFCQRAGSLQTLTITNMYHPDSCSDQLRRLCVSMRTKTCGILMTVRKKTCVFVSTYCTKNVINRYIKQRIKRQFSPVATKGCGQCQ